MWVQVLVWVAVMVVTELTSGELPYRHSLPRVSAKSQYLSCSVRDLPASSKDTMAVYLWIEKVLVAIMGVHQE